MIEIIKSSQIKKEEIFCRVMEDFKEVDNIVSPILADVKQWGDEALRRYTEKFDHVKLDQLAVTPEEIKAAVNATDENFLETLRLVKENIVDFHKRQKKENFIVCQQDGIVLGQKHLPIERVGIYVPGGTANYPSSVLMNALPAAIAGVKEIIMVSPCGLDEKIPDIILAAAYIAGVTHIFKIGGAQAIGALAYGTQSVPRVDKIVGPGNRYVSAAKRLVYGMVDIDMIAGPSEILVLADETCDPRYVAADMLSQAEHDEMASAVLVTDSRVLAEKVKVELQRQLPLLAREKIARSSIKNNGKIILTADMKEAVEISNAIAPEHLEICMDDPFAILNSIQHAGSVFLGKYAPEALGDYFAGPNHVLPTSGTARFASPLGVDDFMKRSSFVYYTKDALAEACPRIVDFAEREGLTAHGRSVSVRFEEQER